MKHLITALFLASLVLPLSPVKAQMSEPARQQLIASLLKQISILQAKIQEIERSRVFNLNTSTRVDLGEPICNTIGLSKVPVEVKVDGAWDKVVISYDRHFVEFPQPNGVVQLVPKQFAPDFELKPVKMTIEKPQNAIYFWNYPANYLVRIDGYSENKLVASMEEQVIISPSCRTKFTDSILPIYKEQAV